VKNPSRRSTRPDNAEPTLTPLFENAPPGFSYGSLGSQTWLELELKLRDVWNRVMQLDRLSEGRG